MWFKLLAGHLSLDAYLVLGLGTRSTSQMEFIIIIIIIICILRES